MTTELHYPGDAVDGTVGRVMGPTTLGQSLCAYHAEYDPKTHQTTAHMRPATQPEVEAALGDALFQSAVLPSLVAR